MRSIRCHCSMHVAPQADRAKYYADPDFVSIPVEGLLSKEYAAQRRVRHFPARFPPF